MKYTTTCLGLLFCWTTPPLLADGFDASAATAILNANQNALVEIHATLTLKPEMVEGPEGLEDMLNEAEEEMQSVQANGVVIDRSGIIAAPLNLLNPSSLMGEEIEIDSPLGKIKLRIKSHFSTIKVVTADGQEYPADVIVQENLAGLALLKLANPPESGIAAVKLVRDLPALQLYNQAFVVSRLSADFGRTPTVRLLRIAQTTPPPFPLYGLASGEAEPGGAAFDSAGRFVGLSVVPTSKSPSLTPFLLPVSELLRLGNKVLPN